MIGEFQGQYRWLSNFWPLRGGWTLEHWFQRGKATCQEDVDYIMAAPRPGIAKRRGREIECRRDWDEVKDDLMLRLVRRKFMDPELAGKLLATGDQELVEGNSWHDNYWGVCHCGCGKGENRLGKILMRVRDELKEEK